MGCLLRILPSAGSRSWRYGTKDEQSGRNVALLHLSMVVVERSNHVHAQRRGPRIRGLRVQQS